MSISFVRFGAMLFDMNAWDAELSVCIGVLVCGCPISSNVFRAGTVSLALIYIDPISASAADDITDLMIWAMLSTAPLFIGSSVLFERKKWPPA